MTSPDEDVVRRFYDELCTGRRLDLADELIAKDHRMHDPQVPAGDGPEAYAEAVAAYQQGVDGRWTIDEMFSSGDRVVVRWTGTGTHVADMNGIPPTGRSVRVEAISIHRMSGRKIAESWQVWDTLGFLQQLGVAGAASPGQSVPAAGPSIQG